MRHGCVGVKRRHPRLEKGMLLLGKLTCCGVDETLEGSTVSIDAGLGMS